MRYPFGGSKSQGGFNVKPIRMFLNFNDLAALNRHQQGTLTTLRIGLTDPNRTPRRPAGGSAPHRKHLRVARLCRRLTSVRQQGTHPAR